MSALWFTVAWALVGFLLGFGIGGLSVLAYCATRLKTGWKADMHWSIHEWAEAQEQSRLRATYQEQPTWQPSRQQTYGGGW